MGNIPSNVSFFFLPPLSFLKGLASLFEALGFSVQWEDAEAKADVPCTNQSHALKYSCSDYILLLAPKPSVP